MRALKVLVVAMGVLIVVGVAVLAAMIVQRLGGPAPVAGAMRLEEPAGTRIAGASVAGDRVAITLQGGGPDRVVVVDLPHGRVVGRVALGQ